MAHCQVASANCRTSRSCERRVLQFLKLRGSHVRVHSDLSYCSIGGTLPSEIDNVDDLTHLCVASLICRNLNAFLQLSQRQQHDRHATTIELTHKIAHIVCVPVALPHFPAHFFGTRAGICTRTTSMELYPRNWAV